MEGFDKLLERVNEIKRRRNVEYIEPVRSLNMSIPEEYRGRLTVIAAYYGRAPIDLIFAEYIAEFDNKGDFQSDKDFAQYKDSIEYSTRKKGAYVLNSITTKTFRDCMTVLREGLYLTANVLNSYMAFRVIERHSSLRVEKTSVEFINESAFSEERRGRKTSKIHKADFVSIPTYLYVKLSVISKTEGVEIGDLYLSAVDFISGFDCLERFTDIKEGLSSAGRGQVEYKENDCKNYTMYLDKEAKLSNYLLRNRLDLKRFEFDEFVFKFIASQYTINI